MDAQCPKDRCLQSQQGHSLEWISQHALILLPSAHGERISLTYLSALSLVGDVFIQGSGYG